MRTNPRVSDTLNCIKVGAFHVPSSKPWSQEPPCHFLSRRSSRIYSTAFPTGVVPSEEPPSTLDSHLTSLPGAYRSIHRLSLETYATAHLQHPQMARAGSNTPHITPVHVSLCKLCMAPTEGADNPPHTAQEYQSQAPFCRVGRRHKP